MPFKYSSPIDRLIANTVLSEERFYNGTPCWEWVGSFTVNKSGMRYGKINERGKNGKLITWFVHRWVLVRIKGRRLTKKNVGRHLCNYSLCANPDHLAGGTQSTNVRQCVREGRHRSPFQRPEERL